MKILQFPDAIVEYDLSRLATHIRMPGMITLHCPFGAAVVNWRDGSRAELLRYSAPSRMFPTSLQAEHMIHPFSTVGIFSRVDTPTYMVWQIDAQVEITLQSSKLTRRIGRNSPDVRTWLYVTHYG